MDMGADNETVSPESRTENGGNARKPKPKAKRNQDRDA